MMWLKDCAPINKLRENLGPKEYYLVDEGT